MVEVMDDRVVTLLELVVQKVDNLETRIDEIEFKVDSIEYKTENSERRLDRMEAGQTRLREDIVAKLDALYDRLTAFETEAKGSVSRLESKLNFAINKI